MKHIVFVTGAMGGGGAERVISILSDFYIKKEWRVSIAMLLHNKIEYTINPKVEILDFSNDTVSPKLDLFRMAFVFRKFLARNKPNVVAAFMAQICLVTGLACIGIKTRLIMSERIDPAEVNRHGLYGIAIKKAYGRADLVIFQTKRAQQYYSESIKTRCAVVGNPIRVTAFATKEKVKRIVTVGRLNPQKNQSMLIEAFAAISADYPEYTLDIYGMGSLHDMLAKKIWEMNLEDKVFLCGSSASLHNEIANATLFVLPSNFEGLSNALLEAMMMGLPVISTNCAGSDEVIIDGVNGVLTPVGNLPALQDAMARVLSDSTFAANIALAGKHTAQSYSVDSILAKWEISLEGKGEEIK